MKLFVRARSPYWWADCTVDNTRTRWSTLRPHGLGDVRAVPKKLNAHQRTLKADAEHVVAAWVKRKLDATQLGILPDMSIQEGITRLLEGASNSKDAKGLTSRCHKLLGNGAAFAGRYRLDGSQPISSITNETVAKLRLARQKERNAPNTINREVSALQRLYNLAKDEWGVQTSAGVKFRKLKVEHKLRYLTGDEESALLRELEPSRASKGLAPLEKRNDDIKRALQDQQDLVVFLLDTGARYGEVATITWDAVDTRLWKSVNIYRSKVGNEGVLAMTARLREVLKRRWADRKSPYVFPSRHSRREARGHATKGIMKAAGRAELNAPHKTARFGKFTVHSLRDTFATKLVQRGVSLFTVQKLLGHSSPTMTQKYAHLVTEDASVGAAAVLDQAALQLSALSTRDGDAPVT